MASERLQYLGDALLEGNLTSLDELVTTMNVHYVDPRYRMPLLMWAVTLGRLPTTQLLLSRGASLFPLDAFGFTVLHRAVWYADVEIVRALLFISPSSTVVTTASSSAPHCADSVYIHAGDTNGNDGLPSHRTVHSQKNACSSGHCPSSRPHQAILAAWMGAEAGSNSADSARSEQIRRLSWRPGAQRLVNAVHTHTGRTPLMLAVVRGDARIVHFLMNVCGADMYVKDKEGFSAVDLAALCGNMDIFLAKAPGDGTGSSFVRVQQQVEEYCETAKTLAQKALLAEMNKLMCASHTPQSHVST